MKHSSFKGERLILADPMDPRLRRNVTAWDHIVAALTNSELIALAMFCALGLAVTVGLLLSDPQFRRACCIAASIPLTQSRLPGSYI